MRKILIAAALLAAGCFSPDYQSGKTKCSPAGECPEGYECVAGLCYLEGEEPDLAPPGPGEDMSIDASVDAGTDGPEPMEDLLPPVDLVPPPPIVVPPAAVVVSSGGGSGKATSGASLNMSVPGVSVGGISVAPSGASLSFGILANDTIE